MSNHLYPYQKWYKFELSNAFRNLCPLNIKREYINLFEI